jgi:hypothetical protein
VDDILVVGGAPTDVELAALTVVLLTLKESQRQERSCGCADVHERR